MNSKKIRTLGAVVLAFLVLLYVGYQAYQATHQSIRTETAMYGEVSDVLQAQGFILRNETVIDESYSGVLSYRVADGSRVSRGGVIADIFSNESDAASQRELDQLDQEIENLQSLSQTANFYVANPSMLGDQIYSALEGISQLVNENDFSGLNTQKGELQNALIRRQLITGEESAEDYSQRISQLQSQRDTLASQTGSATGSILAPEAGYFISTVDGLENVMDISQVESITVAQAEELLEQQPSSTDAVGKICSEFKWYFVCTVSAEDALKFAEGNAVTLRFPFAISDSVTTVVDAVNQADLESSALIVMECYEMNEELASLRTETCEISVTQYSGIRVSQKAVHFAEVTKTWEDENGEEVTEMREVKGVYVMHGSEIVFRQIVPLYSTSYYVICDPNPNEDELMTDGTVQLYDEIVVEGTDLYDGKVVK